MEIPRIRDMTRYKVRLRNQGTQATAATEQVYSNGILRLRVMILGVAACLGSTLHGLSSASSGIGISGVIGFSVQPVTIS